jgi:hypothetical protein
LKLDSTRQNKPPDYAPARTGQGSFLVKYRIASLIHLRMPLQSDFHESLTTLYHTENLEYQTYKMIIISESSTSR